MLSCIVAVGPNNEIGYKNELLYNCKEDMKIFIKYTKHKHVIMGYNTWRSLKTPVLKDRENLVIIKGDRPVPADLQEAMDKHPNLRIMYEYMFESILHLYMSSRKEYIIIGGASLYEFTKNYWSKIYITKFKDVPNVEADAFFPGYNKKDYYTRKYVDNGSFEFTELIKIRGDYK